MNDCCVLFNVDFLTYLSDKKIAEVGNYTHALLKKEDGLLYLEDFDGIHDFFGLFNTDKVNLDIIRQEIKNEFGIDLAKALHKSN